MSSRYADPDSITKDLNTDHQPAKVFIHLSIHPSFIQFRLVGAWASLNRAVISNLIINQLLEKVFRFKNSVRRNECLFLETILRLKPSVSATSRVSSNRKLHHAISLMNPLHLTSDFCCNWKLEKLSGSNILLCVFLACSLQAQFI